MDLIPSDYRRLRQQRIWIRWFGAAMAVSVLVNFAVYLFVNEQIADRKASIAQLEQTKAINTRNRIQLEQRLAEAGELQMQLDILEGLRGGTSARMLFLALDRSLVGHELWLRNWEFDRTSGRAQSPAAEAVRGYFVVAPASGGAVEQGPWQISAQMNLRGQALDHAALSRFVRRFVAQPEIVDVRVISTRSRHYSQRSVVDFELRVVVNSNPVEIS